MISGRVNLYREAIVRLSLRSSQGREQAIEAIPVDAADTDPLLGMSLLYGHELNLQVIEGGDALIRPLLRF